MAFTLRLLPDDKENREASRTEIRNQTRMFVIDLLRKNSYNSSTSSKSDEDILEAYKRYGSLAEDLLVGRFWGALDKVDGMKPSKSEYPFLIPRDIKKERNEEKRTWAKENFSPYELGKILNLVVNQAFLRPYETSLLGTQKRHSILYEELIEKEGSMFAEAVTDEFRRRLNNGRFWEELPDTVTYLNDGRSIYLVRDVLENHFEDLDVDFAVSHGLELMASANHNKKLSSINLKYIGEPALARYAKFLSMIDEHEQTTTDTIEELFSPYLTTVLDWDIDFDSPYYDGQIDFDEIQRGTYQEKLQVPIVQKYLAESKKMRDVVAGILANGINNEIPNHYGQQSKFVKGVLDNVPNPKAMMTRLLMKTQTASAMRFFSKSEEQGHGLYELMPS